MPSEKQIEAGMRGWIDAITNAPENEGVHERRRRLVVAILTAAEHAKPALSTLTFDQWWDAGGSKLVLQAADKHGWKGAAEQGYIGGLLAPKPAPAALEPAEPATDVEPYTYFYRYSDPMSGKPVWRSSGGLWNGQRPSETLPLFTRPPESRLRAALESIANNTCCSGCQEAALVARAALAQEDGR